MKVKAISLWEPWASLMRVGAKTIETRSWATSYRGPLLICAAKRWTHEQDSFLWTQKVQAALVPAYGCMANMTSSQLPFGKAVCLVDLVNCWPTEKIIAAGLATTLKRDERPFGDFTPDRFAWITTNLRTFDPFPVTGRQGLFEVELPAHVAELIK